MSAGRVPAYPPAKHIWCDAKDHARPRKYLEQNTFSKRGVQVEYRGDESQINGAGNNLQKLQAELWSRVVHVATAQPTPVVALAVSGMNDVLNSQGYAQAAWWNRIPAAAWMLMGVIAIASNILFGYREWSTSLLVLLVVPVVASVAFFLIADIDSPRGGVIRVSPRNLIAVSQWMNVRQGSLP
jgi:uncharacterized membrane protein